MINCISYSPPPSVRHGTEAIPHRGQSPPSKRPTVSPQYRPRIRGCTSVAPRWRQLDLQYNAHWIYNTTPTTVEASYIARVASEVSSPRSASPSQVKVCFTCVDTARVAVFLNGLHQNYPTEHTSNSFLQRPLPLLCQASFFQTAQLAQVPCPQMLALPLSDIRLVSSPILLSLRFKIAKQMLAPVPAPRLEMSRLDLLDRSAARRRGEGIGDQT